MDEGLGKVQKVNAHPTSFIMVNGAVVEGHIAALDAEASTLPNKGHITERSSNGVMEEGSGKLQKASTYILCTRESSRTCQRDFIQRGDG